MKLEIKDYHEAEALYSAIETQLEGTATDSLERDRLERIRYRVEMLMVEYKSVISDKGPPSGPIPRKGV